MIAQPSETLTSLYDALTTDGVVRLPRMRPVANRAAMCDIHETGESPTPVVEGVKVQTRERKLALCSPRTSSMLPNVSLPSRSSAGSRSTSRALTRDARATLRNPNLSKVDQIGFPDLLPRSAQGRSGFVTVVRFEVFGKGKVR
jgi:hypothetical protein